MTWTPPTEPWYCDMCFPDHVELGHIAPGLSLVLTPEGHYMILGGQGHRDDHYIIFTERPELDPIPDWMWGDEEELEKLEQNVWTASDEWIEKAESAMAEFSTGSLRDAWTLMNDLIEAGYDPQEDGNAELWIYGQCARIANEFEKN